MKKPGLGVMIIEQSRPMSAPPKYGKKPEPEVSHENHEQETPEQEREFHERGGKAAATPASVNFRTAAESCGNCEYMEGSRCVFLAMPVSAGDSCGRFEARSEDEAIAEHDVAGQEMEGDE